MIKPNEIRLKRPQWDVFTSNERYRLLVAGRRFGKTFLALVELCRAAWAKDRLVWYVAPTYKQGKRIAWEPLKKMTKPYWAAKPNETDLRIELITGGTIALRGADNFDSLRGDGLDFLVLDEYASMDPRAWTQVLRPALADREGGALFIGTPRGFNHFHDLYKAAQDLANWKTFQYTTEQGGNVALAELESATHELDEKTYRQEFQAKFENLTAGLVYYTFERGKHVRQQTYDPRRGIFWSLDFNINPMCSLIGQQDGIFTTHVLKEMMLPDSRTPAACEAFLAHTKEWYSVSREPLQVRIYGDATGSGRKTAASQTDWQIVREFFNRHRDLFTASFQLRSSNPEVKDRVACVNSRLRNQAGERHIEIDPRCQQLIADLEQVHWRTDASGNSLSEIDKSDPKRTHLSDAFGYMIEKEFPMKPRAGERSGYVA
jgi:hypothetical protein